MSKSIKNLKDKVFSKLTVLAFHSMGIGGAYWRCECSCGKETIVLSASLTSKHTTSCGCAKSIHGDYHDPIYYKWMAMKQRVASNNYKTRKYYKDKGIIVCERWKEYINFKEDMFKSYITHVELYGKKNTTLERVDNNKGYCPENCCWATWIKQNNNRGTNNCEQ